MTIGKTATIVSVGKPLPESLVGQQVEILRFISPSFPAVRTADGREYILDASRLDFQPQLEVIAPPLNRIWLEARMRHFERIIPKLARNPNHYRLVQGLQAEYEQVLQTLGINDEEVEF